MIKTNSTTKNNISLFSLVVLSLFLFFVSIKISQASGIKIQQPAENILSIEKISVKLRLAEKNKRINPTLFKKLITELNQQQNTTIKQQYSLDFLNAYNLLYKGKNSQATSKFEKLLLSDVDSLIKFKANYLLIYLAIATKNWQDGLQYVAANIKLLPTIGYGEPYQNSMLETIMFYSQIGQYQLALNYIDKLSKNKLSAQNSCGLKQLSLEAKFNLK